MKWLGVLVKIAAVGVVTGLMIGHAQGQTRLPPPGHKDHGTAAKVSEPASAAFSEDISSLPDARPMDTIELMDGSKFVLTAAPVKQKIAGRWVRRLAYNGSIPGPVLKVKQGATVHITLKNDTEVETTLHPHGIRTTDKNDGVVGIGQPAIAPGQSHVYVLTFIDAGVFWYHPHVREDYAQDLGLYGNFLVVPQDPGVYSAVNREIPLLIDDVSVKEARPYYHKKVTHTLMGRFGDVMLINGQDDYHLNVTKGEVIRFFITNTANTRTINFGLPGARMKLVGGDNGLFEYEQWADTVMIAPSERYIVEAYFPKAGTFNIENSKPSGAVALGSIAVEDGRALAPNLGTAFETLRIPSPSAPSFRTIKTKLQMPPTHEIRLTVTMDHKVLPMSGGHQKAPNAPTVPGQPTVRAIEWDDTMADLNALSDESSVSWKLVDAVTQKENMGILWTFKKGDFVKIRIFNDPKSMHPMQHPIHFHGQRFVVAAIDGKTTENLVWKDSVLIASGETLDLVLEASNAGNWMAHCHIAEHLSSGMMLGFRVLE